MSKVSSIEPIDGNSEEMRDYLRSVRKIRSIRDLPNSSQESVKTLLGFSKVFARGSSIETTAELLELRHSIPDLDLQIWIDEVATWRENVLRENIAEWLTFLSKDAKIRIRKKKPFVVNIEDPMGWDISIYDENTRNEPLITPDSHLSWLTNRDRKIQFLRDGNAYPAPNEGFLEYLNVVSAHFDRRMYDILLNNLKKAGGNDFKKIFRNIIKKSGNVEYLPSNLFVDFNCLVINPDARDLLLRLAFDVATKRATLKEIEYSLPLIAFDSVYYYTDNTTVRSATNPVKLFFKEAQINEFYLSNVDRYCSNIKESSKSKLVKFVKRHELFGDIIVDYLGALEGVLYLQNYHYEEVDYKLRDIFIDVIRDLYQELKPDSIRESENIWLMSLEDRISASLRKFYNELGQITNQVEKIKRDYEKKKGEFKLRRLKIEDIEKELKARVEMDEEDELSRKMVVAPRKMQEQKVNLVKAVYDETSDIRKREKQREKNQVKRAKIRNKTKVQIERSVESLTSDEAREFSLLTALLKEVLLDNVEDIKNILKRNPTFANVRLNGRGILLEFILYNEESDEKLLVDVVKTFIEVGVNLNIESEDKNDALTSAVMIFNVELVKLLLNAGARVDKKYASNLTLLHVVVETASKGKMDDVYEITRLLIEKGADPSIIDKFGNVAADYAETYGYNKLILLLGKKNSELVRKESQNWKRELLPPDSFFTPLLEVFNAVDQDENAHYFFAGNSHRFVNASKRDLFKVFMKSCHVISVGEISKALSYYPEFASLNIPGVSSPVFYVVEAIFGSESEKLESIEILVNHGADLAKIRDQDGNSILHSAAYCAVSPIIIRRILEIAPNLINVENSLNLPPLMDVITPLLFKRNGLEIFQILLEKSNKKLPRFKDVITNVYCAISLKDESEYLHCQPIKDLVLRYKEYIDFTKVLELIISSDDLDFLDGISFNKIQDIRIKSLEELRRNGINILGFTDSLGFSTIERSLLCGYYKMSSILMNEEFMLNSAGSLPKTDDVTQRLIEACLNGDFDSVQEILKENTALINIEDSITGETLIHYACLGGNIDIFEFLVERGIDINKKTKMGFSPFMMLCNSSSLSLADHVFTKYQPDLEDVVLGDFSALIFLCGFSVLSSQHEQDRLKLVEKIITQRPDLMNKSCALGYPLSIIASSSFKYELLELFLENGALDAENSWLGNLALKEICSLENTSAENSREKLIEILIRYGVDPNIVDDAGNKVSDNVDLERLLQKKFQDQQKGQLPPPIYVLNNYLFADIEYDPEKMTFQDKEKFEEIINLLKISGRVNSADKNGKTLLHYACEHKNQYLAKSLLENGSNPIIRDEQGQTALSVAFKDKNDEFAEYFKQCYREVVGKDRKNASEPSNRTSINSVLATSLSNKGKVHA